MQKPFSYGSPLRQGRRWLSYQRYALLAFSIAGSLVWITTMVIDPMWWSLLFGGISGLSLMGLGIRIMAQTGKKMAIARRAQDQISEGVFEPSSMMKYCTDPCWRVVVSDVLKEANIPTKKRRALIKAFSKDAVEASKMLILVNRHDNLVYTLDGSTIEASPLHPTP